MKITAEPRSDQWNVDDFIGGPRTFTVAGVKAGKAEQKYDIELVEGEGRVWRPPITVLRILIAAWGDESSAWAGRRVTLFADPSVRFGSDQVGGIRVSHLSHISKPLSVSVAVKRGQRKPFTVQPLAEAPVDPATIAKAVTAITNAAPDKLPAIIDHATRLGIASHPDIVNALNQKQESH